MSQDFYEPTTAELDHDVEQLLTAVLGDIRARGVEHEVALRALRRVARELR